MKCRKQRITACLCALLLIIPSAPLSAKSHVTVEASEDIVANLVLLTSVSALLVISIPLYYLVYLPIQGSQASSNKYHDGRAARLKAKANVPDMEVKEVGEDEKGNPQVRLQDPNNPENYAVLMWPERKNNPTTAFQEGTLIRFQPSAQGSGWLLRDDSDTALAFIPAEDFQGENHSDLF